MRPPFTPIQAAALCEDKSATIEHEGWTIGWDGPMMSPSSAWAPYAEKDNEQFFCSGEIGDPIDADTYWVQA